MTNEEAIIKMRQRKQVYIDMHTDAYLKKHAETIDAYDWAINIMKEQESILDKIKEEIKENTYFINETTEKEGIDFETVEKIINKYRAESEDK